MTNFDGRTIATILAVVLTALPTAWARAEATPLADVQLAQAGGAPSVSPYQATGPLAGMGRLPGDGPIYGADPIQGTNPTSGVGPRGRSGIRNSGEATPRD